MFCKIIIFVVISIFALCNSNETTSSGQPLFLTPLIKSGEIETAVKLAKVTGIFSKEVLSYSGFVTVNEEYNSNLFFWFFPASKNWEDAPVILWSDGGPGITMFHSVFNLNGPYQFNSVDDHLELRNSSWNQEFNVIYIDNPVGVGFSCTNNEDGYPTTGPESAPDMYKFLTQFFKMFPSLKDNDFYNAGASFGANYATSFAHYIHTENQNAAEESRINLKGVILDSPWFHPIDQIDYGTFLFNLGLIDEPVKEYFDTKRDQMVELINKGSYKEAAQIIFPYIMMDIPGFTGYNSLHNFNSDKDAWMTMYNYTGLITGDSFRKSVHVGDKEFDFVSQAVQGKMSPNFMKSVKHLLLDLLNVGYKTLVISGNLDVITGHLGVQKVLNNLEWKGSNEFSRVNRKIWKSEGRVVGYVKYSRNLRYALIRNAGHGCSTEQPDAVLKLVYSFIKEDEVSELVDGPSIPGDKCEKKDEL